LLGSFSSGFCLEDAYHHLITSLVWGMYVFDIMVMAVVVNAYSLDSYPEGSGEVAAFINIVRMTGEFVVSYFQVRWANSMGTKKELWHPGCDLRGCVQHHHLYQVHRQAIAFDGRKAEFCDHIAG
jgi:hypothetical protein